MAIRPLICIASLALIFGLSGAQAADPRPDLNPGQWTFENVSRMEGSAAFPEQRNTSSECITEEDLGKGREFLGVEENCEIRSMDMTASRARYELLCTQEGMEVEMQAEMHFSGDTLEGQATATMQTPIGPMRMRTEINGHRTGPCD
ncbi:DUF3617 domain-containing protein [Ectothiorhodospira mobilis]|uniref:DUF3617 domain-containing protein n=1 Tax=Ectothiorhodospira mobilis TaxID=195064 RepID=UPI0019083A1B|nr:DUF3617 family protein [Ectothiorhodospira mobilis]